MLQISHTCSKFKFQPNTCSSCFKQYFPFLLEGENIHNNITFIKSIASSHYFIKSIASSHCVEDTLGVTLVHPLIGCLENSDRKVKQFCVIPQIASSRLVYCSMMQCPIFECAWFCNVTPDLYGKTVTQQTS